MRRSSLLDLIHAKKVGLTGDVKAEGSFGYNDPKMVKFKILRARRGAEGKIRLNFRRTVLGLYKDVLVGSHWIRPGGKRGLRKLVT